MQPVIYLNNWVIADWNAPLACAFNFDGLAGLRQNASWATAYAATAIQQEYRPKEPHSYWTGLLSLRIGGKTALSVMLENGQAKGQVTYHTDALAAVPVYDCKVLRPIQLSLSGGLWGTRADDVDSFALMSALSDRLKAEFGEGLWSAETGLTTWHPNDPRYFLQDSYDCSFVAYWRGTIGHLIEVEVFRDDDYADDLLEESLRLAIQDSQRKLQPLKARFPETDFFVAYDEDGLTLGAFTPLNGSDSLQFEQRESQRQLLSSLEALMTTL